MILVNHDQLISLRKSLKNYYTIERLRWSANIRCSIRKIGPYTFAKNKHVYNVYYPVVKNSNTLKIG